MIRSFYVTSPTSGRVAVEAPGLPVLEILQNDTLTVSAIDLPIDSIVQVSGPVSPTITGLGVAALTATGAYLFNVSVGGVLVDLRLVCYAAGAATAIPDQPRNATGTLV